MAKGAQSPSTAPDTTDGSTDTATTARIGLSAEGFALATLFERVSDAQVELEPTVADATDRSIFTIRSDQYDGAAVEDALHADPTVETVENIAKRENEQVCRVVWNERPRRFVRECLEEQATVLTARGREGRWTVRLLFPDRDALSRAYESLDGTADVELERISTVGEDHRGRFGLTDEQREALVAAFESGYYDIPRKTTADELAAELGISHQALSERFRRAYEHLVVGAVAGDCENDT